MIENEAAAQIDAPEEDLFPLPGGFRATGVPHVFLRRDGMMFHGREGQSLDSIVEEYEASLAPQLMRPAEAQASIIAAIDAKTAAILAPYPLAERMSFDAKVAEARAVLAADPEAVDLVIAPLLAAECAAEAGAADEPTRRGQVVAKARTVAAKAAAWGELAATLSGIRQRAFVALGEAGVDVAAVRDAALAEIKALRG